VTTPLSLLLDSLSMFVVEYPKTIAVIIIFKVMYELALLQLFKFKK